MGSFGELMVGGDNAELREAIYFAAEICGGFRSERVILRQEEAVRRGLTAEVYRAVSRILTACVLAEHTDGVCVIDGDGLERCAEILRSIVSSLESEACAQMYGKAAGETRFFFDRLGDIEYEVYSRVNYSVSYEMGVHAAQYLDLTGQRVLELGGNSGGMGAALVSRYAGCDYTVVDTHIPCSVGRELAEDSGVIINFAEGDVFDLRLPGGEYGYIVMANLLHDFDDDKCGRILRQLSPYCGENTRIVVIEDVLLSDTEPHETVMHGLRLAVECRGGGQRTFAALEVLFGGIGFAREGAARIGEVHSMAIYKKLSE